VSNAEEIPDFNRLERLLALLLLDQMKETSQQERIVALSRAGFANQEIAALLGTSGPVVSQQLYSAKNTRGKSRVAKKRK
jgi:DNA-binding CsgD family transcriptional regulator